MHLLDRLDRWTPDGGAFSRWATLLFVHLFWGFPLAFLLLDLPTAALVSAVVIAVFTPYPTFCLAVETARLVRRLSGGRKR
jgi:hypothetical protein